MKHMNSLHNSTTKGSYTMDTMTVNESSFQVLRLLGKGKGGYSYLVTDGNALFVLKQIHHEPCDYYTFGNKIESELNDYQKLSALGIPMPQLLDVDRAQERILKTYIEGETIDRLVMCDAMLPEYYDQIHAMCRKLYAANTNIDYYPTNFVVQDGILYYIDFECNPYMDQWNYENWGSKYWYKTPEFQSAFGK